MNFYKDLQHDYENKALKWSVNFQGPEFDIPEKLKEDVALIGDMCKVSQNNRTYSRVSEHTPLWSALLKSSIHFNSNGIQKKLNILEYDIIQ